MTHRNLSLRTLLLSATLVALALAPAAHADTLCSAPVDPVSNPSGCVEHAISPSADSFQAIGHAYGGDNPGTAWFEYGTTDSYGASTTAVPFAAHGTADPAPVISGLAPSTEYHYRLVVSDGVAPDWTSDDQTMSTAPGPIANLVAPQVLGTPQPGQTLVCDPGKWSQGATYTFSWVRDGVATEFGETPTYAVGAGDVGVTIQCVVAAKASHANPVTAGSAPVTITATVAATGVKTNCTVPSVKQASLHTARARLSAANCHVGKITHAYSSSVKKGRVIKLLYPKGKKLPDGTKVGIVVSKGKKPKHR